MSTPNPIKTKNAWTWLGTAARLAWAKHAQKHWAERVFGLVMLSGTVFFVTSVIFMMSFAFGHSSSLVRQSSEISNMALMEDIHHPMAQTLKHHYRYESNPYTDQIIQLMNRLKNQVERDEYQDSTRDQTRAIDEPSTLVRPIPPKMTGSETVRLVTGDLSAWPNNVRTIIEEHIGPIAEIDERAFLSNQPKHINDLFVGTHVVEGQRYWWVWKGGNEWDTNVNMEKLLGHVKYVVFFYGRYEQEKYLDTIRKDPSYTSIPAWTFPTTLSLPTDVDSRAVAFVVLSISFLMILGIPSTLMGFTWDQARSKNILEPYATMAAPPWVLLVSETIYYIAPLLSAPLLAFFITWAYVGWDVVFLQQSMVSLGCALVFAIASMQINSFLVINFVTPLGRTLGRILFFPMMALPFFIQRVFWAKEMTSTVQGQGLEELSMAWYVGGAILAAVIGLAALMVSSYRMARHRKGFLNIK